MTKNDKLEQHRQEITLCSAEKTGIPRQICKHRKVNEAITKWTCFICG